MPTREQIAMAPQNAGALYALWIPLKRNHDRDEWFRNDQKEEVYQFFKRLIKTVIFRDPEELNDAEILAALAGGNPAALEAAVNKIFAESIRNVKGVLEFIKALEAQRGQGADEGSRERALDLAERATRLASRPTEWWPNWRNDPTMPTMRQYLTATNKAVQLWADEAVPAVIQLNREAADLNIQIAQEQVKEARWTAFFQTLAALPSEVGRHAARTAGGFLDELFKQPLLLGVIAIAAYYFFSGSGKDR